MDGVVEIIPGRERRRRWSTADKLRLVAQAHEPGTAIRAVAARHGVCESLLFTWRRQVREGALTATPEMPVFMPVHMIDAAPTATMKLSTPAARSASPARPPDHGRTQQRSPSPSPRSASKTSRNSWLTSNREGSWLSYRTTVGRARMPRCSADGYGRGDARRGRA